ncbi:RING/U-box superfamily protein [Perilla frutescens var. hirtella]|uniref:RING/U-box superfamily protein n=1 Tax=Perilla frutescens var. hirtella TaxID=608512 RepID=A0AAD4JA33_PERFH|nr:RING/U-box superfamily protein [Perilla frutescens var. hirtella]
MVRACNNGDVNSNSFAKTICSICFEDLKPLVEDLQSISICGHVFHELCLQQWFEYCPNLKKRSCPICKQACTNATVGRLYFQSVGDTNDCSSQKPCDFEKNPEELQNEVNRLEGKVGALASSLEQQQKEYKEVKDELLFCNEQLKAEVALKKEALTQAAISQQLLRVKSEELDRSTLESMRFKERSMALARELATYRLAYDMDLKEDEAMKLASLGDAGSREGNYLLIKSLDSHKRSYKELLAKCNDLGRREARNSEELENANKKIKKLKLRVRELATAVEIKENEALRVLKDQNINLKRSTHEHQMKKPANQAGLDESSDVLDMSFHLGKEELPKPMAMGGNEHAKGPSLTNEDKDILYSSTSIEGSSYKTSMPGADNKVIVEECHDPRPVTCFDGKNDVEIVKSDNKDGESCPWSMRRGRKRDRENEAPCNMDDEVICFGDTKPVQTSLHAGKDTRTSIPASQPDVHCFSGGLLGPDGTNRHLGKWCKKAQKEGSNVRTGDLIAVGADGRGGKIKFMRSLHQSSLDINDTSSLTKKCKQSAKPNKMRGQGVLQIEHFFRRAAGE